MYDLAGWQRVPCIIGDLIRAHEQVTPASSLTDPDGIYGAPIVYTEWALRDSDEPVLREYRYPGGEGKPDRLPCDHYVPEVTS
jgi:hypothetical protein